ncbi:MAG: hypothetical protein WAU33_13490 [Candidatus Binataceae bacterium]
MHQVDHPIHFTACYTNPLRIEHEFSEGLPERILLEPFGHFFVLVIQGRLNVLYGYLSDSKLIGVV